MTTRDDVLDVIHRIETADGAGDATRAAQAALTLPLPASGYNSVLNQLRSAYPKILGSAGPPQAGSPTAAPQRGRATQAMKDAEAALMQQFSTVAEFDRQVIEALRHAHTTTVEGRRRLDGLEAEVVGASKAWDLSTATGAREFQRFLIAKLAEIIRVVEEANDDDTSKQALATALMMLYAAQTGRDEQVSADRLPEPTAGLVPPALAEPDDDPYLDALPVDEQESGYQAAPALRSEMPAMPAVPGLGGESPGLGAMPSAMPAGLPLAGLLSGPRDGETADDDESPPDDAARGEDASRDAADGDGPVEDAAPDSTPDNGPVTITLPDGTTTTVADRQLAAAMQAAADGTPVADAFRRQGIDIPPPGTPVTAPVDQTRLRPGDIGMFTDRHALAVGNDKALLDGQIHLTGNLRGPGFLGWQHPPVGTEQPISAGEPVPTRPAMAFRGPFEAPRA
ncbi:MAG: DUF4226 domain-containing protein [Mycobacterium sp.]